TFTSTMSTHQQCVSTAGAISMGRCKWRRADASMGPWSQHPSSQQPSPTHIGRRSNGPALFGAVEGKRMSVGMQGRSLDPKRGVATAIAEAQANLERAVEELDR